jgi:SRSO17 transposase
MKNNIVPKASPDALPELAAFVEPFAPLFRRHTSRDSMERYLTGLLTDLPHKTADTIAAAVAGTSTERLQHLLTDAAWDAQTLDEARVKRLLAIHPPRAGVLVFDDTGLPKKGTESVGVAAQYSGTLGKIGNCQVVVSAEYLADDPASSTPFHWPVSAQLYLPESWITDQERRKRTHVPAQIGQQTKPEIALSLLDRAQEWGVPIQAVVVDAGYGDNPHFLAGLDARQVPYVCAVESTFGVRLPDEVRTAEEQLPTYGGRGQPRKPRPASLYSVKELIAAQPESAWQTIAWREGTKGTMQAQVLALRVHWATGSPRHSTSHSRVHTGPAGWVLAERPVGAAKSQEPSTTEPVPPHETATQEAAGEQEADETKYWFSTLPPDTPLERLVTLAHVRWVIEQFYEDAKQECGLDDFQGRRWDGLHRHLALVMLAYSFLALQRLQLPLSAGEAFPPLRHTELPASRPSPGAALALSGSRPLAHSDRPDQDLPSQKKLTK